jgi:clan AA aspartic protease
VISGVVNSDLEALVEVVVFGSGASQLRVTAAVDTGFNGHLILPPTVVATLQLPWLGADPAELADGRVELFDVYRATVLWQGQPRTIEIEESNSQPLLGMKLLDGQKLEIDVVVGGAVTITPLP